MKAAYVSIEINRHENKCNRYRPSEIYFSDGFFVIGRRLGIRVRKYINPQIPVIPLRFRALQIVEHLQAVHHKIFSNLYLGGDGWVFPEM